MESHCYIRHEYVSAFSRILRFDLKLPGIMSCALDARRENFVFIGWIDASRRTASRRDGFFEFPGYFGAVRRILTGLRVESRTRCTKLTELKNFFVCGARNISEATLIRQPPYICVAIRKTAEEVSWPFSSLSSVREGSRRTEGVFPLCCVLGTARWDHHGDRRPHTFIRRDVSPWSYPPLSFVHAPQASYPTFVRSTLIEGRRIVLGRIHPPRSPVKETPNSSTRRGAAASYYLLRDNLYTYSVLFEWTLLSE